MIIIYPLYSVCCSPESLYLTLVVMVCYCVLSFFRSLFITTDFNFELFYFCQVYELYTFLSGIRNAPRRGSSVRLTAIFVSFDFFSELLFIYSLIYFEYCLRSVPIIFFNLSSLMPAYKNYKRVKIRAIYFFTKENG